MNHVNYFLFCLLVTICFQNKVKPQSVKPDSTLISKNNLVFIEGGWFKRGDKLGENDEKPIRRIKLESFYLGKYEVTNAEFVEFLNSKGNQMEGNTQWINLDGKWNDLKCRIYKKDSIFDVEAGFEDFPVNFVSWYGANAYCKWKGGRLPSEAEWEYAAKGGKLSNKKLLIEYELNLANFAWFDKNSDSQVHKKGQKTQNILGLYDILGNLWEWCNDFYSASYYNLKIKSGPKGPTSGDFRVIRGGSWTNQKEMLRISNRNAINSNSNKINVGFRIAF